MLTVTDHLNLPLGKQISFCNVGLQKMVDKDHFKIESDTCKPSIVL